MDYYEALALAKNCKMNLEDLVSVVKKIPKSENKFLAKSMIECMAKIKYDKRIQITYEKKESGMRTVVFLINNSSK